MQFLPFDRMLADRIAVAKQDSDTALFSDLMYLGEMVTKLTTAALVASIQDDRERQRYRLCHGIIRATGLGGWVDALESSMRGPATQLLIPDASQEKAELIQSSGSSTWQYAAVASMHRALRMVEPNVDPLGAAVEGLDWFRHFKTLRNRTRGHGALRGVTCSKICPALETSIRGLIDNFALFKRPWAYLHRNISGKYRVTRYSDGDSPFGQYKRIPAVPVPDGVYVFLGKPVHVELVTSDADASDFHFPNGGFSNDTHEVISYLTGITRTADARAYLAPAGQLPASETDGLRELDAQGLSFSNVPPRTRDYVSRKELEQELRDALARDNHPIVTLSGRGGIGKTTLAVSVIHDLADQGRFEVILWFSARDIDLLDHGPKLVQQRVKTKGDIAREYIQLTGSQAGGNPVAEFEKALREGATGPTLFVVDNFETVSNPTEMYLWLDTHVRAPNKILITTRHEEFKGDWPVAVGGMSEDESMTLISMFASHLGVTGLLTTAYRQDLFTEAGGHPYVMKVLLGEVAKAKKLLKIDRIVAAKDAILEALFERTFTRLSPAANRVFLTLCSWRSTIPQVALEAVLLRPANEKMDVADAIDELRKLSLVEMNESEADRSIHLSVPLTAMEFGRRKLSVSPYKTAVQADLELLQALGAARLTDLRHGMRPRLERMISAIAAKVSKVPADLAQYVPILEYIARADAEVWLMLCDLYESRYDETGDAACMDSAKATLRRYLEQRAAAPSAYGVWERLARLCYRTGDVGGEVHALAEMCEATGTPFEKLSETANRVNGMLRNQSLRLDSDEKRILIGRLTAVMEKRLQEASATDCSRIAWLFLNIHQEPKARQITEEGLKRQPSNTYCLGLAERLGIRVN
jgi:hypothetical protein